MAMGEAEVEVEVDEVVEEVVVKEEDELPPPVANKQMGAESKDDEGKSGKGRKYQRRDMTAEG
jgi:hypothetical protein